MVEQLLPHLDVSLVWFQDQSISALNIQGELKRHKYSCTCLQSFLQFVKDDKTEITSFKESARKEFFEHVFVDCLLEKSLLLIKHAWVEQKSDVARIRI